MLKNTLLLLSLALGAVSLSQAQRLPTASKLLDIQAGGSFVYGKSDYHAQQDIFLLNGTEQPQFVGTTVKGFGGYGTIDFLPHFGLALDFHQANRANLIYERTYEVGGRYVQHYGRINPYIKLMYGRGVFNFPPLVFNPALGSAGNLAYNLGAIGGGVDYNLRRSINIRGDYEYQHWKSGPGITQGLTPWLASVGVAYHFH